MTFWPLANSDFPTDQTFHQFHDLYTEFDLHRIMSGFHGAFATGVASQQGTLTLPDTWFRPPFWDLLMLQLLRPNSSNLSCIYSTFHLEYPLVLSRFCLLLKDRRLSCHTKIASILTYLEMIFSRPVTNFNFLKSFSICWMLLNIPKHASFSDIYAKKISFPTPFWVWKIKMFRPMPPKRKDGRTDRQTCAPYIARLMKEVFQWIILWKKVIKIGSEIAT